MTHRTIELVGGPNDGMLVADHGPIYREPERRGAAMYIPIVPAEIAHLDTLPEPSWRVREYEKRIDARDLRPRYVLREGAS